MKVRQFLTQRGNGTLKLHPEESLPEAALRFSDTVEGRKYSIAVVTDSQNRVVGILSLGDIVHALGRHKYDVVAKTVGDVMTKDVCVAEPDDDLSDVMRRMAERQIRHVPVVENGSCRGLIARRDAMEAVYDETLYQLKSVNEFVFRSGARY